MEKAITQPDLMPVADWLEFGKARFGADYLFWRFECPICHHIQTGADFEAIGQDAHSAYQECIGRHLPGRARTASPPPGPCDYAAFGLFQSRWKVLSGTGKPVPVFPFASVQSLESPQEPNPGAQGGQS